jgi:short subunit dehydrogenase-like uncharacterized protein
VESSRPLAVLGATGYTGGLVLERARGLGLPLRLVGRRREALERLASDGDEVRVADARHERELIDAFEGAFAVASTAGPFLARGARPVAAAIAAGAHYLDISVEQAFTRLVLEGFDAAIQRKRPPVYAFEEQMDTLLHRCEKIGVPLAGMMRSGALSVVEVEPRVRDRGLIRRR